MHSEKHTILDEASGGWVYPGPGLTVSQLLDARSLGRAPSDVATIGLGSLTHAPSGTLEEQLEWVPLMDYLHVDMDRINQASIVTYGRRVLIFRSPSNRLTVSVRSIDGDACEPVDVASLGHTATNPVARSAEGYFVLDLRPDAAYSITGDGLVLLCIDAGERRLAIEAVNTTLHRGVGSGSGGETDAPSRLIVNMEYSDSHDFSLSGSPGLHVNVSSYFEDQPSKAFMGYGFSVPEEAP